MKDFDAALARARTYTRLLLRRGRAPEDIAAALVVEGAALSNATGGRTATANMLRGLAEYLEAAADG